MPSTNVNVGLLEGRSSCRVLKPPGGGHSDIFGRGTTIAEMPVRTTSSAQLSGIRACLYTSDTPKRRFNANDVANGASDSVAVDSAPIDSNNGENANGKQRADVDGAAKDAAVEGVKKPASPAPAVATAAPLQKVRVPPGGFSSGFW